MRNAYFLVILLTTLSCGTSTFAQNRTAIGIKAGGLLGFSQKINHAQEGSGTGISEWSTAYGYTAGLVLIVPVQRVDYLKFGFQCDKLFDQSFSILDSSNGPDYSTESEDYYGFRIPITYHKQFEASGSTSRRRVSFFLGGDFKFLNIPAVSSTNSSPDANETLVLLNHTLDPGIIVGAGLINGFKKSGALHFELAFQYHPIKNLNVEVGADGLQESPEEFNSNTLTLSATYFFTKNKDKRRHGNPSQCPKL